MRFLRKFLFPFAILYWLVTSIRNLLYDLGFLKSYSFDIPLIAVGNLSVGGTGKTPQIEYLIRLLSSDYKIATLSRGYKRKSKGFVLADSYSDASILGDEPFQFYEKFPNIQVAVDADRKNGIEQLLSQENKPEIILLDDAFQHRKVKAGFYILLTSYNDLYTDDFILPMGNLRESRLGADRADVIIVTKCPRNISSEIQMLIKSKLKLNKNQQLFFTFIDYDNYAYSFNDKVEINQLREKRKVLVAGISNPESFFNYLKSENDMVMEYPDHHSFTDNEISDLKSRAIELPIVTTEKDYVRLKNTDLKENLYYLPIKSSFVSNEDNFKKTILKYVGRSTRNC